MDAAASLMRLASSASCGAAPPPADAALAVDAPRGPGASGEGSGPTPISTGVAAPSVVAGAMAATWLA